ncbi:thioredoxin F2, chloroplastic-like [Iris pallida]|uniref:Thioredoxin F2, chloroplastic-like n=1 Tax=Iris pallida TaxID=29817 RepID=A0AAX6EFY1_IRIPA|nr:thioredoxin F2, chloroplastic-like [Iris pallida]
MALQISLPSPAPSFLSSSSSSSSSRRHVFYSPNRSLALSADLSLRTRTGRVAKRGLGRGVGPVSVRSSLETAAVTVGQVTEVNKDTFWPLVEAAGPKLVVLDMYTQWCGPCKVMAPKFQALSEKYLDVVFLKLDCNQENKPLAKELGIKVFQPSRFSGRQSCEGSNRSKI